MIKHINIVLCFRPFLPLQVDPRIHVLKSKYKLDMSFHGSEGRPGYMCVQ